MNPNRPHDIVCRVHHYLVKQMIVRKAWVAGTVKYAGADIQILADLSRATLQRRTLLRPLLQALREKGIVYRWGYPFHLLIREGDSTFALYSPEDLL